MFHHGALNLGMVRADRLVSGFCNFPPGAGTAAACIEFQAGGVFIGVLV
jgi:hypothetical protein